jgi:NADPH:quinone reductase-like Zn-dependent oxidoreductase
LKLSAPTSPSTTRPPNSAGAAGDHGVDLVVEVGGVGTLNESIRATRIGGTVAFIGVLAGRPVRVSPAADGDATAAAAGRHRRLGGDLQAMADAIAANRLTPVMDKTFPLAEAKAAFAHMASGAHFGKVAIAIP